MPEFQFQQDDALAGMPEECRDAPVTTQTGLAAIALNLAMKYADMITVKDGALYQQYKLEGRNIQVLHLAEVFNYAQQIEAHLLKTPSRLALMVLEEVASDIGEVLDASGMSASGQDPQGLEAKPASPTAEGADAQ